MENFKKNKNNIFVQSNNELKSITTLATVALFIAVHLFLDRLTTIPLTATLHVSFKFVAIAAIGMLYGPSVSVYASFIMDILAFFLYPKGAYFPGYTITAMVTGLIFGLCLYKKKITVARCFFAKLLVNVICNLGINSLWAAILTGNAYIALLIGRTFKNVVLLPVEVAIMFALLTAIERVYARVRRQQ